MLSAAISRGDALFALASSGLIAHQLFKRYEPNNIPAQLALAVAPPAVFPFILDARPRVFDFAIAFAAYLSTLIFSIVVYRLSPFHPLARYPGPLYLKVSKFPVTWIASRGRMHTFILQLHERYGDAVRVGPNEVSIRDPDAVLGVSTLPKGPKWINQTMAYSNQASLIAERNPHEHARRRKPWNRAFSTAALKGYEEIIGRRVSQLVDVLSAQKGAVDLGKWIDFFTYDFMSDMCFGGGSEMLKEGDAGSSWHILSSGLASFHVIGQMPWTVLYARRIPKFAHFIRRMVTYGLGLAVQRVKNGSLSRDLFYYLNNEDGAEPSTPPFKETISNGSLAMIAGSDTTSITLSNLFYLILKDGDAYKRLQAEVDRYFPAGENALDTKHHANMPFLNAVINETLRLIPVLPDGSQRRVAKGSGGRTAGPYYLPEGTVTYVHFYSLHRHPAHFSHPTKFDPDRWLLAAAPAGMPRRAGFTHNAAAFVPFSFGPNNCVGKGLALQEMRMLVSQLVQRFEMRFADGWDPRSYEDGLEDWFTIQKPPLMVILTPRKA